MGGSVKRAISLPREQDEKLREIAHQRKAPYSALIQVAVSHFLELVECDQWSRAYESYYARKENVAQVREAVSNFMKLSRKVDS